MEPNDLEFLEWQEAANELNTHWPLLPGEQFIVVETAGVFGLVLESPFRASAVASLGGA